MKDASASLRTRSVRRWMSGAGWIFLCMTVNGCALLGSSPPDGRAASGAEAVRGDDGRMVAPLIAPMNTPMNTPMTQSAMELLFAGEVDAILGPSGAIQTKVDGINVYLISDPVHDRMRIIVPIALTNKLDPRYLGIMLEANFHRTGDARYSTSEGVVYAAFMHPISSLSPKLLKSALAQVLSLAKTFGTRFSSGVLPQTPVSSEE